MFIRGVPAQRELHANVARGGDEGGGSRRIGFIYSRHGAAESGWCCAVAYWAHGHAWSRAGRGIFQRGFPSHAFLLSENRKVFFRGRGNAENVYPASSAHGLKTRSSSLWSPAPGLRPACCIFQWRQMHRGPMLVQGNDKRDVLGNHGLASGSLFLVSAISPPCVCSFRIRMLAY